MQHETEKKLKELGVTDYVVADYNESTSDFRSILTNFRKKGIKSLVFYGYDQLGTAMHQARTLGLTVPFYSVATVTSPGFQAAAKGAENGTFTVAWAAPKSERYQQYIAEFKARKGREPFFDISNVPSYDVANILVSKLQTREIPISDEGLIDFTTTKKTFYGLKDYPGVSGKISVSADGSVRSLEPIRMRVFRDGKIQEISE